AYTQQINVEDPMDNEIFTVSFRNAIGCMFQLKTVIQKTKVNVSFMYGVLGSYDPFPGHGWENWYDTCTRTATFVDFSSVRNGKKDRITWTIDGLNAFSRDSLWTYQFPDVAVPTTYRVMLTVIAENGCADTASHLITIYPSAKVKIQPLCYGNSLYLKAVPLRHTFIEHNWTWKDADGIGHIQQGDSILVEGPFTYFLRSLSDEGCHSTDTFKVTSFDGNLKLYTIEGKITHHGNPLGNVNVYAGADYTLTNADGEYCIIADSNASLSLTPNLSGYRFLPASISCPNITNNLDNQHFTAEIPVTGINLSPRQLVMTEGGSYGNVKVSVTPNNADNKIVHTTNTNSAAAEILSSTVYAKSEGTTLLIFTTEDGGFSDTCEVIVKNKIPAMDIEIYPKNLTIVQGNSALLYVNFVPTNASDRSVSWQSLDNAVAAVNNNGTVTAAAVGTTSVVVTTADGNFSDTCQVIVQGVGISNYGLGIMNYLVYPNPTTGKFSVLSSQLSEMSSEIEVFDVVGRKLLSHTPLTSHSSPLIEIDISHLANGLYFLKIQTDSGTVTKKVVKQ
ncbi:MAG: Ig-like domain-containing protein, partial [Lentimicrobiaceae bacterium]|nr:Ig-like domain-containing protein [Lentimicrobiaceae bacterium]